jgi:UDP-2-acetamido-3-amino-2,3-dideoxy-glucuronate N-acetyltransferase
MSFFVHEHGLCETQHVGAGTRIWAFAHVLPGAQLGRDCNICDHVFVENDVVLGDRVTVKCGVSLWDGLEVGDDVFIGPNAAFTNDGFPRSKQRPPQFERTIIRDGASLGANCTILPGLTIGKRSMVGAGCVLTRDVPANAIVVGNPARIVGYVDTDRSTAATGAAPESSVAAEAAQRDLGVRGASLRRLVRVDDLRGSLVAGEAGAELPFTPARMFSVMLVPSKDVRGAHAHRQCEQFLVCQAGSVSVVLDDGNHSKEITLADPSVGLHIPAMVWSVQYRYTPDALLLVLASRVYEADDYIRDYDEFLSLVRPTLP